MKISMILVFTFALCCYLPSAEARGPASLRSGETTSMGGGGGLFGMRRSQAGSRLAKAARRIIRCNHSIGYCLYSGGRPCGRPAISNDQVKINNNLDCSGFLSAAFGMAGVRIHNRQDSSAFMATTRDFGRAACLPAAELSRRSPLQEGDLINISGNPGHVVMISKVGRNPFSCHNPHPANWNFNVVHSSRGASGPAEVHPSQLDRRFTNILTDVAKRACSGQSSFSNKSIRRADDRCITKPLNYSINGGRC